MDDKKRFEIELEFVQCLCNPRYMQHLAQKGFFEDDAFLRYLSYLQYWQQPEYARFLIYPQALYFLKRLQEPEFRQELSRPEVQEYIHSQQFYHWQYRRKHQEEAEQNANNE